LPTTKVGDAPSTSVRRPAGPAGPERPGRGGPAAAEGASTTEAKRGRRRRRRDDGHNTGWRPGAVADRRRETLVAGRNAAAALVETGVVDSGDAASGRTDGL